jgi:hypothetical protein
VWCSAHAYTHLNAPPQTPHPTPRTPLPVHPHLQRQRAATMLAQKAAQRLLRASTRASPVSSSRWAEPLRFATMASVLRALWYGHSAGGCPGAAPQRQQTSARGSPGPAASWAGPCCGAMDGFQPHMPRAGAGAAPHSPTAWRSSGPAVGADALLRPRRASGRAAAAAVRRGRPLPRRSAGPVSALLHRRPTPPALDARAGSSNGSRSARRSPGAACP